MASFSRQVHRLRPGSKGTLKARSKASSMMKIKNEEAYSNEIDFKEKMSNKLVL